MRSINPLVSIVVPIYNVEKYLEKIITSIIEQPFNDFELILVNDGSLDESGKICDKFAKLDERILVIHKENGGPSNARNTGIEKAGGKYIVFIDPDDQITEEYLTKLYNIAEENKCDAVVGGYKTFPNNESIYPGFKLQTVMTGKELILSSLFIYTSNDLCFNWRNIYKLQLIKDHHIRFNDDIFIGEDTLFNLEFLLKAKRVYATPHCYYLYTINNPDSLMKTRFKPKLENSLVLQYRIKKQLSEGAELFKYRHYKKDLATYNINNIYTLMINNLKNSQKSVTNKDLRRIVNYPVIRDSLKEIGLFYRCNNFKEYAYYLALRFKFYPLLLKVLNH